MTDEGQSETFDQEDGNYYSITTVLDVRIWRNLKNNNNEPIKIELFTEAMEASGKGKQTKQNKNNETRS